MPARISRSISRYGRIARFLRISYANGVNGEGYLYLGGDTAASPNWYTTDPTLRDNEVLRNEVLKGFFATAPGSGVGTPLHNAYVQRLRRLPSTLGTYVNGTYVCHPQTDDEGDTFLWAQDHDSDPSTPDLCAGFDPLEDRIYDAFAYDAVFAIAYALHDLIHVQNRTAIVGSELLDSLERRVEFEGVTGLLNFHDGSAHADNLYNGDRRIGVSYDLMNYAQGPNMVSTGTWRTCPPGAAGCPFSEKWSPTGVGLVFSTADNNIPSQTALPKVDQVRIGMLLPMFLGASNNYFMPSQQTRTAMYLAIQEINNKSDSIADWILPDTRLELAYRDSKCDSSDALNGALALTRDVFVNQGVSAILGAACSSASETAALAAAFGNVPIISASSTSPTLSDREAYPSFLRTVPSDVYQTEAILDVVRHLFNYTRISLITSRSSYGLGGQQGILDAAPRAGVEVLVTNTFSSGDSDYDYSTLYRQLREDGGGVIVLFCNANDASRFLARGLAEGVGGEGFLWFGADDSTTSTLWTSTNSELRDDPALREQVLKGYFGLIPQYGQGSRSYADYRERLLRLPPTVGNTSSGECNFERDNDGATYLWAQE